MQRNNRDMRLGSGIMRIGTGSMRGVSRIILIAAVFMHAAIAAAQQPSLKTQYIQTDEIRGVQCTSDDDVAAAADYTLATVRGSPRVFLVDGVDPDCPGELPAECTFTNGPLIESTAIGLCPGVTSGAPK